jgi:hypothetical protein
LKENKNREIIPLTDQLIEGIYSLLLYERKILKPCFLLASTSFYDLLFKNGRKKKDLLRLIA